MSYVIAFIILLLFLSLVSEVAFFLFHVTVLTIMLNHAATQMTRKNIRFNELPRMLAA